MKIDFNQALKDINGKALSDGGMPITLRDVAVMALLDGEKTSHLSGIDKARNFRLAVRINGDPDSISVEEVAVLKDHIGRRHTPLIVGQAFDLLEGESK